MNKKARLIILTFLIYAIPILLISWLPYSKELFGSFKSPAITFLVEGKTSLTSPLGIAFDFLLLYCAFLLLLKEGSLAGDHRVDFIYSGIKKIFRLVFIDRFKKEPGVSKEEKASLLFYLVKIIFVPVMLNFAIGNINGFLGAYSSIPALFSAKNFAFPKENITGILFPLVFNSILVVDTLIFSFGYLVESKTLKNTVKSVEPTILGWLVTVMCYPPFNTLSAKILGWHSSDFSDFGNINTNIITGIASLLLFIVYVWATVALGFKASNLTNRGIIGTGPYKYIRHPAYVTKNLSWWIMGIPFIKTAGFAAVLSLTLWSFVYYLRALTEERHLMHDPDYVEYIKKVKYKFIPGIF